MNNAMQRVVYFRFSFVCSADSLLSHYI